MEDNNWISVEDRLPYNGQKILFLLKTDACRTYKQYKVRLGNFLLKDQWGRENMFCDGAFFSSESIDIWCSVPPFPLSLQNKQLK